MNLKPIIDRIADQADDFLDGVQSREQARAGISEMVTLYSASFPAEQRGQVIDGVMRVLENEGFFDHLRAGTPAEDDEDDDV